MKIAVLRFYFLCLLVHVFLSFKLKYLDFCDGFRIVVAQSVDLNIAQMKLLVTCNSSRFSE